MEPISLSYIFTKIIKKHQFKDKKNTVKTVISFNMCLQESAGELDSVHVLGILSSQNITRKNISL